MPNDKRLLENLEFRIAPPPRGAEDTKFQACNYVGSLFNRRETVPEASLLESTVHCLLLFALQSQYLSSYSHTISFFLSDNHSMLFVLSQGHTMRSRAPLMSVSVHSPGLSLSDSLSNICIINLRMCLHLVMFSRGIYLCVGLV